MNATETAALITEVDELRTTFYVSVASFTVLVYDHLITLPDEIKYIWYGKKGPLIWLFFINRYLTPLGFIVNLIAYFSDLFEPTSCEHFVRYEGSMTFMGINTTALMMLLRVYAMYEKRRVIVAFCCLVFVAEFAVNAWLLTFGVAVRHTAGIHACTMIFDPDKVKGAVASASAWLPLLYDTIVLILTIMRTYPSYRHFSAGRITRILLKEGIVYYGFIFTITLILTVMIVFAPNGLKNITAQTEYLVTVAMMSRITLHLKKEMTRDWDTYGTTPMGFRIGETSSSRFGRSGGGGTHTSGGPLNITVQEYSIVHDDRGEVVRMVPLPPGKRPPGEDDEWAQLESLPRRVERVVGRVDGRGRVYV